MRKYENNGSGYIAEAEYYLKKEGKAVMCVLCPNGCIIKDGGSGKCRSRINRDGKLYSIAYGNPCSVAIDPVEKKPLFHFLPGSDCLSLACAGCNLSCANCQNWEISQKSPSETSNYDLPPQKVVGLCKSKGLSSIAYTYTEPLTYFEYIFDTAEIAHENGIRNILVSAGYINKRPLKKLCRVIDAANIDLKSFDDKIYEKLNGGKLAPVLNTLKMLKDEGVWLEITNLVIPSWNDDPAMIRKMCIWLVKNGFEETPLHFSRFFPMYRSSNLPPTPVPKLYEAASIAASEGLKYVYIGNVPDSETENTFCPGCRSIVVERNGFGIMENHIKRDRCALCGTKIAGIWE
ncbi:MAG: AmmeMemoRadiSam system radical SAM enzyme [Bacteroidales bacterium]|jgi:pyruvate formate lyase activating enzyme|nr:AmmeMemoRadiSam system radical SAM enzyme [Bacteroidales bacterium]